MREWELITILIYTLQSNIIRVYLVFVIKNKLRVKKMFTEKHRCSLDMETLGRFYYILLIIHQLKNHKK